MIGICPACHEVKHIGLAQVRGRMEQAIAHMCKVNGCGRMEACEVLETVINEWNRRSTMQWVLDLTAIEQYGVTPP